MSALLEMVRAVTSRDVAADRVVPPAGFTVRLTLLSAAAMSFLAVFALALSLTTGRIANRWGEELARASTVRISAPVGEMAAQTEAALRVLQTTPGIETARALTDEEQRALLEPWFGPGLPVDQLPIPRLIEVIESSDGYDSAGLTLRLSAEVPAAVLDDHGRWRRPLLQAAGRLRMLGWVSIILIAATSAAMVTLAAHAALAANEQVIKTLRLIGATDSYIASAFVRRFTLRTFAGAVAGTIVGVAAVLLLPNGDGTTSFLSNIGFGGFGWVWPVLLPFLAATVAFLATFTAARRVLEGQR